MGRRQFKCIGMNVNIVHSGSSGNTASIDDFLIIDVGWPEVPKGEHVLLTTTTQTTQNASIRWAAYLPTAPPRQPTDWPKSGLSWLSPVLSPVTLKCCVPMSSNTPLRSFPCAMTSRAWASRYKGAHGRSTPSRKRSFGLPTLTRSWTKSTSFVR